MLRLLLLILGGIVIGTFVLIFLLPFLILSAILRLFSKEKSRTFVWHDFSPGRQPYSTENFEASEKRQNENLSESVYDIKAEVINTRTTESDDSKQLPR